MAINLPNQITASRLVMAVVLFVLLSILDAAKPTSLIMDIATGLFLIAAVSDIADGYLARKYKMVTVLGRIADPFVDKILVCGSFICLIPFTILIRPWMVVIIIGREFLISGIRGYAESRGIPFPATIWGKMKTVLQCITITAVLIYISHLQDVSWVTGLVEVLVWTTLAVTVLSGYAYVHGSRKLWSEEN